MGKAAQAVMAELSAALEAEYRPGDQLPGEPALASAYGVSRATMREALQELAASGLVRRVHGVGTFVARVSTKVESALDVDLGVTEAIRAANRKLGIQVLSATEIPAPNDIAASLELPPAGRVLWIERAILVNDEPAVSAVDVVPLGIANQALRPYEGGSVYRFLEEDCGISLAGGAASVTAVRADRRVASVLRVEVGSPVLRISQLEKARDGTVVLYSEEHYVPNLFDLTIRRTRRGRADV